VIFNQGAACLGLYLVSSGQLLRRAERLAMRLTLGMARSGDLVELAAALGDRIHTYTLLAQTPGTVLLLPIEALQRAFQSHPPLRMRLLEELAREVSRAYHLCSLTNLTRARRRGAAATRTI
jgi:CRP-like cAMP-binding protein